MEKTSRSEEWNSTDIFDLIYPNRYNPRINGPTKVSPMTPVVTEEGTGVVIPDAQVFTKMGTVQVAVVVPTLVIHVS